MAPVSEPQIRAVLATVNDPEIKRPITELGMVDHVTVEGQRVGVRILLTVSGCPMKETLTREVTAAVLRLDSSLDVTVDLGVMTDDQRKGLQDVLRGGRTEREIPFAKAGSLTKVYAIASGKGGVGKSSVTVNLALAMAAHGLKVGVLDADVYGHSVPDMLGIGDARPTQVEDMILPVPVKGMKVMSVGMLKPRKDQVVAWRGPMLDRALVQMLSDVYWGDLDTLLVDLPPGTGDVAISLGQHLPNAEVVVVTTPQPAAASVAERAGTMASMMHQRVVGVIENMSYLELPATGERMEIFGSGGAEQVAATLSTRFGYDVPVLGQVPLDQRLRIGGDDGLPIVEAAPETTAARVLTDIATRLGGRSRGLAGMQLGLAPAGRL
ncbi:MAG: Mrp/NBP35 family ATP-binding protein [Nocardioidaceae bacterium]